MKNRRGPARPLPPVLDPRDFLRWARTQPADRPYTYTDPAGCPVADYLRDLGFGRVLVGPAEAHLIDAHGAPYGGSAVLPHSLFFALIPESGSIGFYGDMIVRLETELERERRS